jgi:hypothetical protein
VWSLVLASVASGRRSRRADSDVARERRSTGGLAADCVCSDCWWRVPEGRAAGAACSAADAALGAVTSRG